MPSDRLKADSSTLKSPKLLALGVMFLASGTVALVYEAAWQREFTLLFGSSAPATAAVLAAYFAGLGLGSVLLGKLGGRIKNPLAIYGFLELAIGFGALIVTPILSFYAEIYPGLVARFGGEGPALIIAKGVGAFAAIAIPTLAMGGTLPVLAQIFEARRERFGELAGWLYLLNTAGAACGVASFPWLLGAMGMEKTVKGCAGLNFVVGACALSLARRPFSPSPGTQTAQPPGGKKRRVSSSVALAFISGFVIFVLQVGWTRAFAQVHENSIYSFSFVVAVFILAIAFGAQVARAWLRKKGDPRRGLSVAWMIGGLANIIAPFLFIHLTDGLKYSTPGSSVFSWNLVGPALVAVVLPVLFLAVGLPLILHHVANASRRATGDLSGMVLAGNMAGCILGALAGGFLFPGTLGLWRTIILMGTLVLTIGVLLSGTTIRRRIPFAIGSLLCGGIFLIMDLPRTRIETARGERLLALEEGAHGVVAVVERSGSRRLKLNNHYVLGGTAAIGDERMQAHIPLMLHGRPRAVAFLGYGTGITAGTVALHPVEESIALELVPEVAELAARFFSEVNPARSGPRVIIEDARNFLRGSRERFDVIIGDLVVPWRQGEGALYTLEQFTVGRERLAPGGIYCAWLPMFQLNREDFELIVRTFRSVFSNVSVWRGDFSPNDRALALIGSLEDHLDSGTVRRRLRELRADQFNPQLQHDRAFWLHFVGILHPTRPRPVSTEQLNTENRPRVELRRRPLEPFVGRALESWENNLRRASSESLKEKLSEDALKGWEAGELMSEFTHLMLEQREREATAAQQRLRATLGELAARSIFGQ
jgi:spermidine synthase